MRQEIKIGSFHFTLDELTGLYINHKATSENEAVMTAKEVAYTLLCVVDMVKQRRPAVDAMLDEMTRVAKQLEEQTYGDK